MGWPVDLASHSRTLVRRGRRSNWQVRQGLESGGGTREASIAAGPGFEKLRSPLVPGWSLAEKRSGMSTSHGMSSLLTHETPPSAPEGRYVCLISGVRGAQSFTFAHGAERPPSSTSPPPVHGRDMSRSTDPYAQVIAPSNEKERVGAWHMQACQPVGHWMEGWVHVPAGMHMATAPSSSSSRVSNAAAHA